MGRGEGTREDEIELPATAAPLRPISFSGLEWNELGVSVRARLEPEGRTTRLGIHPSGFGMYLTLDTPNDLDTPFLGPLCGADYLHTLCPGSLPCLHHRLYGHLESEEGADGEVRAKLREVRGWQPQPSVSEIGTYALEGIDALDYHTRIARLDRNTYVADVVDKSGTPLISCLVDHGVCRIHTVLWKGAGCIGRLLALSWLVPPLIPLLETETEYAELAEGLTRPPEPYPAARSRFRSIFSLATPATALDAPLLARTSEQLLLVTKKGNLPIELLALREAQCLLCRTGPGPGAPLPCARHPGLARLHASLIAAPY